MSEKIIITVAGNMGVGKSTLTQLLAESLGWEPFFEEQKDNPYLADFYGDMERWGFHSQLFFLSRRLTMYERMMQSPSPILIQDRGMFEDAEVFARNLYNQKKISERDFSLYMDLYTSCMKLMPIPGFVIYLQANLTTLLERIKKRGSVYEQDVDMEYVASLNTLYDTWAENFSYSPVYCIPTDDLNIVESKEDFAYIQKQVLTHLEGWKQNKLGLI